jgi:hypothetical protein
MKIFKFRKTKPKPLEISKEIDDFKGFPKLEEWNPLKVKFAVKIILTFGIEGEDWFTLVNSINEFIETKRLSILIRLLSKVFTASRVNMHKFQYYDLSSYFTTKDIEADVLYGYALNCFIITGGQPDTRFLPTIDNGDADAFKDYLQDVDKIKEFKKVKLEYITYFNYIGFLNESDYTSIESIPVPLNSLFLIDDNSSEAIEIDNEVDLISKLETILLKNLKKNTIIKLPIKINRFIVNRSNNDTSQ